MSDPEYLTPLGMDAVAELMNMAMGQAAAALRGCQPCLVIGPEFSPHPWADPNPLDGTDLRKAGASDHMARAGVSSYFVALDFHGFILPPPALGRNWLQQAPQDLTFWNHM